MTFVSTSTTSLPTFEHDAHASEHKETSTALSSVVSGSMASSESSRSSSFCTSTTSNSTCSSTSNGTQKLLLLHAKENNSAFYNSERCRSPSFERVMLGLTKSFGFDVLKSSQTRRQQRLNNQQHACTSMASSLSPSFTERSKLSNFSSPSDEAQRRQLFEGLRNSEEAFCLRLTELNESYLKALHQRKILDSRKCSHLFQFISRVAQLHRRLLKRLNSADSFHEYPHVLLKSADEFKCYSPFLLSFHKLIFTINELLRQNSKFSDLVSEVTSKCARKGNRNHKSCVFPSPTSSATSSHVGHSGDSKDDDLPQRRISAEQYLTSSGLDNPDLSGGHSHVCDRDIRSLFAAPILRLPAYENFLTAVQAETPIDTDAHRSIADALSCFAKTREWIDQSLTVNPQSTAQVRVIQTLLHTRSEECSILRPLKLTDVSSRRLVRYGFAQYICGECTNNRKFVEDRQFCSIFLFSDSLVWCDVRNQLLGVCTFRMCSFRGTRGILGDVRGFEISSTGTSHGAHVSERNSKQRSKKTLSSAADTIRVHSSPASPISYKRHVKHREGVREPIETMIRSQSSTHLSTQYASTSPATAVRKGTEMTQFATLKRSPHLLEPSRPASTPPLSSVRKHAKQPSPPRSTLSTRCSTRNFGSQKVRSRTQRAKVEFTFPELPDAKTEHTKHCAEIVFSNSREATEWVRAIKDAIRAHRSSHW